MRAREPHSHRRDPAVPAFPDGGPVVFMDGDCALCSASARALARLDRAGDLRIATAGSPLGRAMLAHYGLDPDDPESWLYLEDGAAYTSLEAVARVGRRLGGWGRLLAPLGWPPRPIRDWLYRRIARNRYRLFGRADLCALPDPALRARLLE